MRDVNPTTSSASTHDLAADLLEALVPLLAVVHHSRTISPGKMGVLREVARRGRASAAELVEAIGVSQQGVSLAAKELESLGLLERRKDDVDRRRTWFHLTPEGEARFDHEMAIGRAALRSRIDAALTADQALVVEAALPLLRRIGLPEAEN